MNNGWKEIIQKHKLSRAKIKLLFQYPGSDRAIKKSGEVIETFDDCFEFEESRDGDVSYSYKYLVEVKEE